MGTRKQIGALLCAILLLASLAAIAIRSLTPVTANDQPVATAAKNLNTTNRAKAPLPRYLEVPSFEITTRDEGALWDEGLAYDISEPLH